jgi:phosphoribosylanthranilate isomerase
MERVADSPTDRPAAAPSGTARPRPVRPPVDAPPPKRREPSTRVKICGVTRLEDAEHAVEHGAWAVGMIFWRESRRRVGFEQAQLIGASLKRRAEVAGVFVNAPLDEIERAAEACQLTLVQLHGDEGPQFCGEVARRTGAKVIKAARVRNAADVTALRPFHTEFHLLDTFVEGRPGGTGQAFDWELAKVRRAAPKERQPKLLLSGGLTPDNVADAILTTFPWAVDVAGGTEAAPGRKDPALVEAFIAAAHGARAIAEPQEPTPADGGPGDGEAPASEAPAAEVLPSAAPDGAPPSTARFTA